MKRNILWMRKILLSTFIVLVFSMAMVLVGMSSPIPTINQTSSTTMVYLDPPTINGTAIGVNNTVTVNINITDASNIFAWQMGLTFNATALECLNFFEGEFLSDAAGPDGTGFIKGNINNTAGLVWRPYMCMLKGEVPGADGDGRLAYATFKVKAPGVSDIHLSDVKVMDYDLKVVPVNIIDIYTVVLEATAHTVVTVSNLTGSGKAAYGCCFYDHDFNSTLEEVSFKVAGPSKITQAGTILEISESFSNVTIPIALLPPPEPPHVWAVIINDIALSIEEIIKSENTTHTSIYFTFPPGINDVHVTTRFMPSTISIALSEESISLGSSVTISGAIDPVRQNVTVTIYNRTKGDEEWDTLATVKTNQDSEYISTWEPGKKGTFEIKASWEGDMETLRDESDVKTLKVKGAAGIPLEVVAVVVVAIIVIAAVVVYFVKIRKT